MPTLDQIETDSTLSLEACKVFGTPAGDPRLQNAALCAYLSGSGIRRRGVSILACLVARTPLDSG